MLQVLGDRSLGMRRGLLLLGLLAVLQPARAFKEQDFKVGAVRGLLCCGLHLVAPHNPPHHLHAVTPLSLPPAEMCNSQLLCAE
jgi:hypothetical protein